MDTPDSDPDGTRRIEHALRAFLSGDRQLPDGIGPFRLLDRIGAGGMGVVYRAEQQLGRVRREVALKVIHPDHVTDATRRRFEFEAQALAAMEHEAIARVYDTGFTANGEPFLAMELVAGEPITAYCDSRRLDIRARIRLFQQVCAGVDHAHGRMVLHRDLKPGNVLVTERDGRPVAKIIDFGIARALDREARGMTALTEAGSVGGTREYMAPEQVSGASVAVDVRADVYALGAVLYELLTGELPFDSGRLRRLSWTELERVLKHEEPPRPSARVATSSSAATTTAPARSTTLRSLANHLTRELDWIVLRAMAKDPTQRYRSAGELGDDLARYLRGDAVLAGPPTPGYRLRRFLNRHRRVLAVAAVVMLATGLAIWTSMLAVREAGAAERQRLSTSVRDLADTLRTIDLQTFLPASGATGQTLREDHAQRLQAYLAAAARHGLDFGSAESRARLVTSVADDSVTRETRDQIVRSLYQCALTAFKSQHAFMAERSAGRLAWQPGSFAANRAPTDAEGLAAWEGLLELLSRLDGNDTRKDRWRWILEAIRTGRMTALQGLTTLPPDEIGRPENLLAMFFLMATYGPQPDLLEMYRTVARVEPQLLEPHLELCLTYGRDKDESRRREAKEHGDKALMLAPDNLWLLAEMSHMLRESGALDDAIGYARKAVAVAPTARYAWETLGDALFTAAENVPETSGWPYSLAAVGAFARALELGSPRVVDAARPLGLLFTPLVELGFLDQKAADPRHFVARPTIWTRQISLVGERLANPEQAYRLLTRCVTTAPEWSLGWFQLGVNLRLKGFFEQAITCYQRALDGDRTLSAEQTRQCEQQVGKLRTELPFVLGVTGSQPDGDLGFSIAITLSRRGEPAHATALLRAWFDRNAEMMTLDRCLAATNLFPWNLWKEAAAAAASAAAGNGYVHTDRVLCERFAGVPFVDDAPFTGLPVVRHDQRRLWRDSPEFAATRRALVDLMEGWLKNTWDSWYAGATRLDIPADQRQDIEGFDRLMCADRDFGDQWRQWRAAVR